VLRSRRSSASSAASLPARSIDLGSTQQHSGLPSQLPRRVDRAPRPSSLPPFPPGPLALALSSALDPAQPHSGCTLATPMSSASLRLTEPCIFLVGGLDWERARQRQRRAAQRAANAANTPTNAGPAASATVGSPSQSRHPSPDRDRGSRAASLSRPGSRAASPAPRGRLGELAQQGTDEFVPPNSRGRSHSRTRQPTPTGNRTHSLSRGRDGSLVRDMTDAQLALQQERDEREDLDEPPPALLRGLLTVHLSKPTRIKEISVRFKGTARTDWPEGASLLLPPLYLCTTSRRP